MPDPWNVTRSQREEPEGGWKVVSSDLTIPDDPYDQAIARINETSAQSRFTKTPIRITRSVGDLGQSGDFDPRNNTISVYLDPKTTYDQFAHMLTHEDIHALLSHAGHPGKVPIPNVATPYSDPISKVFWSFVEGGPSGIPAREMPAYLGAYRLGELSSVSPEDRKAWLKTYEQSLPAPLRSIYDRMIASHDFWENKSKSIGEQRQPKEPQPE